MKIITNKRFITLLFILVFIFSYFFFGLNKYLSLNYLQEQLTKLFIVYDVYKLPFIIGYMLVYILITGSSLPGATALSLLGGIIFGFKHGVLIVSFASSIGATLAFLLSRYLLHDWVQSKFQNKLTVINEGIKKDGAWYLFSLRLVPLFPFFLINLLMGLTPMKTRTFYWVSQLGMFPGTMVYLNAGSQLSDLTSVASIFTPKILVSFALIGIFPLAAKKLVQLVMKKNRNNLQ